LHKQPGITIHYNMEALDLDPDGKGGWDVFVKSLLTGEKKKVNTKFVFIGAGGATLHLLKRAEINERRGYGGFPVSGLWLKCLNEDLIKQHHAKVYGKATVGSPPCRCRTLIRGSLTEKKNFSSVVRRLSTKFLKNGSLMDLPKSIRLDNAIPMIFAGMKICHLPNT